MSPRPLYRRPLDCLGLLVALAFALPALAYPPGNDQALHGYVGRGLLLGELPYRDSISGKPIGIFATHALAILLFGYNAVSIRAFEVLCIFPLAYLVTQLCRTEQRAAASGPRDGELGAAAMLTATVHYTYFDYWDVSHPEIWVALLSLWSVHLALNGEHRSLVRCLGCGALGAAAFMFKYPAAAIALPVALACAVRAVQEQQRPAHLKDLNPIKTVVVVSRAAGFYLLGAGIIFGLCVLPFILNDALAPMWEVLYTFTARYVGQAPSLQLSATWLGWDYGGPVVALCGTLLLTGLALNFYRHRTSAYYRGLFLSALLAAAFASIWVQKRLFSYHFTVLSPFLAAAILYGLKALRPDKSMRWLPIASLSLSLAALFSEPSWSVKPDYSYRRYVADTYAYLSGDLSRTQFLAPFIGKNYLDHYRIHEYIGHAAKEKALPSDTLCARGFAPSIYLVSGMRCPSRHVIQAQPAGLPAWGPEFWRDIRKHLPRFVVTFKDRPRDLVALHRLGYRKHAMPSIYVLMERTPTATGNK